MITTKIIIALLAISILISCRETYRLSEKELLWMPYNGNETLVFSSNLGDTDTILFLKKDTLIAYPEAQALIGKTYEVVSIFARYSDGASRRFVELEKSKDKIARLYLNLSARDAVFYRLTGLNVDSLSQQQATSLATKAKTYSDVYIIGSDKGRSFQQRSNFVKKLYWSKSEGLIRYDKQDGVYWELKTRYIP